MISLMFHAGMKLASTAKKNTKPAEAALVIF